MYERRLYDLVFLHEMFCLVSLISVVINHKYYLEIVFNINRDDL